MDLLTASLAKVAEGASAASGSVEGGSTAGVASAQRPTAVLEELDAVRCTPAEAWCRLEELAGCDEDDYHDGTALVAAQVACHDVVGGVVWGPASERAGWLTARGLEDGTFDEMDAELVGAVLEVAEARQHGTFGAVVPVRAACNLWAWLGNPRWLAEAVAEWLTGRVAASGPTFVPVLVDVWSEDFAGSFDDLAATVAGVLA